MARIDPPAPRSPGQFSLAAVLDHVVDGVVVLDRAWRYVYVNPAAAALLGRTPEELVGRHIWTEFPEGVGQPFHLAYERAMATGTPEVFEAHYAPWDRWFENRLHPSADALTILFTEVTARRQAEHALRESEGRFRAFVEQASDAAVLLDRDGIITYASPPVRALLGHAPDTLVGTPIAALLHPDSLEPAMRALGEVVGQRGAVHRLDTRVRNADGEWVDVEAVGRTLDSVDPHVLVNLRDVSARRRTEEALRASEARLRETLAAAEAGRLRLEAVLAALPVGVVFSDAAGRLTGANDEAIAITGMMPQAESFTEYGKFDAWWADSGRPVQPDEWALARALRDGTPVHGDHVEALVADGRRVTIVLSAAPIRDASGTIVGGVAAFLDVTDRRELEAQLRHAQKMEAVGQLAGGIAHDFNNLLTAVAGNAEVALQELAESGHGNALLTELLHDVMRAVDHGASLTRQLLAFGRKQVLDPRLLRIGDVVLQGQRLVRRMLSEDVPLDVHVADGGGAVHADPAQLEQVLLNLVVNARHALRDAPAPRLTIATLELRVPVPGHAGTPLPGQEQRLPPRVRALLEAARAEPHPGLMPGRYAVLLVHDTGHGMDAPTLARIFDPFFTTKPMGEGTGLGLATVHGIVRQSDGHVFAHSAPGRGAAFWVYLPAQLSAPTPGASRPTPARGMAAMGPATRVLVVEDEDAVRRVVRRTLEGAGFTVIEAADGVQALARWREAHETGTPLQLVVSDMVMPELGGLELARQLHAEGATVPVLLMSGYSADLAQRGETLPPGTDWIGKPFSGADLLARVRAMLDGVAR